MDFEEPLLDSPRQPQPPAYSFLFNPSDKVVRGWKLLMFVVGIYVSWLSPYFFGFLFDLTTKTIWKIQDYVICAILFVDCLISFNTLYFDKNTNAIVNNRLLIAKHFLYGWGSLEIVSVIPITLIVMLFPAKFEVVIVRIWTCTRLVHIRKVFKTLKSWKKSSKPKLVICVAKWTEIIFMTLFTIHCMACILYLIAHTNPKFERTWLSLVEDERAKESNQDLYDYTVSIYWATTSFTTVGYGDIHPVSPRERIANLVMMVFGVGLISYLSSCVNELLAARSNEREELLEALEEYINRNSSLSVELQQEMFNHLSQHRRGDLEMMPQHNILNYFPKNIQMEVKNKLFSARISKVYLFRGVSASFLSHLLAEMESQTFGSNEMVILENEFPENFWILLNGKMVRDIPNKLERTPLHICGELGVVSQIPQPFSVRATEKTTLLMIKQTNLFKLFKVYKEDGEEIFSNMLEHLEKDRVLKQFYDRIEKKLSQGEIEIKLSIQFAIRRNNPRLLLHLLKQGSDLEEEYDNGQTILHIAVMTANIEPRLISILLQYSPDVNKRDSKNLPPISYAIDIRRKAILDVFSSSGVKVPRDKMVDYYKSAIAGDDLELLQIVHDLGGDINMALNENGHTPIYYAVFLEKVVVVKDLLRLKADFHKRDISGVSAFDLASKLPSREIFRLFATT